MQVGPADYDDGLPGGPAACDSGDGFQVGSADDNDGLPGGPAAHHDSTYLKQFAHGGIAFVPQRAAWRRVSSSLTIFPRHARGHGGRPESARIEGWADLRVRHSLATVHTCNLWVAMRV